MIEQLVKFETAKLAKEKGFNWMVIGYNWYDYTGTSEYGFECINHNKISAPTQSLLQKWLREMYGIHIGVTYMSQTKTYSCSLTMRSMGWSGFKTFEEALEKVLQEALKLI